MGAVESAPDVHTVFAGLVKSSESGSVAVNAENVTLTLTADPPLPSGPLEAQTDRLGRARFVLTGQAAGTTVTVTAPNAVAPVSVSLP